jgi:hypothetical protein
MVMESKTGRFSIIVLSRIKIFLRIVVCEETSIVNSGLKIENFLICEKRVDFSKQIQNYSQTD